jgi:hypothetical protein
MTGGPSALGVVKRRKKLTAFLNFMIFAKNAKGNPMISWKKFYKVEKPIILSIKEAMEMFCIECNGGKIPDWNSEDGCFDKTCPFFRLKRGSHEKIKARCKQCASTPETIRLCPSFHCPLWPYRQFRIPERPNIERWKEQIRIPSRPIKTP